MAFVNSFEGKDVVCIGGRVDGTSTASITSGEGFSLTDSGTGDYLLTFDRAFDSLVAVVATPLTAAVNTQVGTITHTDGTIGPSIQILGFDDTDGTTAKDTKFSFITLWQVDT